MTILGADISHYQGRPNFAQVASSGRDFVVIKATESTTFVDPQFAANRAAAHQAGLIVGLYHFARAGNAAAEAAFFVKTIGSVQPGEFLVLDWEVSYGDPPGWSKTWLDAVHAATGVKPLIYMNQSAMHGWNWTDGVVRGDYGLWLAVYDSSTTQPTVTQWPAAAMKQFSDKGTVPGISGPVDVDVFYGTREQLLAYCKGGASPTPQEDDMTPEQDAILRDVQAKLDGYGYRIERIDEGQHGGKPDPWGYGTRIEQTQADVAAIKAALAQLVQQSPVSGLTEDMLEKALRDVLGSLDNKS